MDAATGLTLRLEHRQQMLAHILGCLPEEACGMIGGRAGQAEVVLPVTNLLHSPVRFRMEPHEQLKAFFWLEEQGLDLIAVFHSHPHGPPHPSHTDLDEFAYPGVLALIWSPAEAGAAPDGWQVRAFQIDNRQSHEVPLFIRRSE